MLGQGRRCLMNAAPSKGAACVQRRSGLSVAVAARRAVTVGRWRPHARPGSQVPHECSAIKGRSLCSAPQRFECGGGGESVSEAVCIGLTVHMLGQGRRCLMNAAPSKGAACVQRRSGLSVAVAARRAVTVGRWR
ncbi:hypothetical protein ACK3TF_005937 [Chlorella vulgaris]